MFISFVTAAAAAKWLMAARIAVAAGPVLIAAQRVADKRKGGK